MINQRDITAKRLEELTELSEKIGCKMNRPDLLDEATTHKSYSAEHDVSHYERLEFFGDAVLKFVVAEYLFETYPNMREGELTEIAAVLISAKTLQTLGEELMVSRCIRLGKGVPMRESIIARSTEAIIGALYLDSGMEHVRRFIVDHICSRAQAVADDGVKENYKAKLQQYSQARAQGTPVYEILKVEGPPHDPTFEVAVLVGGKPVANGRGHSKKIAEQAAAKAACAELIG
jgi:ribonuclease-3